MKSTTLAKYILGLLPIISSCSGKTYPEAESLLSSIEQSINHGNYAEALVMMDSLDSKFPEATVIRTQSLALRPTAIEGNTLMQIATADSLIAATSQTIDSLSGKFVHIVNPALVENYYAPISANKSSLINTTVVYPRVDEEYNFYIVCSHAGKNIGLYALQLDCNGLTAKTNDIPEGDERSFSTQYGEKAVFSEADAEDLGKLAQSAMNSGGTITFLGRKGNATLKLSATDIDAIGSSYAYSQAHKDLTLAKIRREKLERQLQIARNQKANAASNAEQ